MLSARRRSIAPQISVLLSVLQVVPAHAAPAGGGDSKAFEVGFVEGQAQFDRGEPLAAARTWLTTAGNLPENAANRENRVAIFEYIAEAFQQGLRGSTDVAALREAATALQDYCDGFTRAFGTETPLSPKIAGARDDFQARLRAAEASAGSAEPPPPSEPPLPSEPAPKPEPAPAPVPTRPWKGLAIGGSVLLALGVGGGALAGAFAARGQSLERQFDDPATDCRLSDPVGVCGELLADGKTSNGVAISGLVAGTLLVAGGVALLATGLRRRRAPASAIAPVLAPGYAGVGLRRSF